MKETEAKAYIYLKSRLRQRQRLYDFALTDYVCSSLVLSVLKHENEALSNAEKRASDEVHSLSERGQRLQASLGTIQSAKEVREDVHKACCKSCI
ncbi:nuclear-pore anchor isoform X2 [Arachis duranensis]|uniref:Nuclear-pore anchor isoform X2 n=1 Tax=Arachis duranensis TaxID=130453 RepID=A0A9C6U045_ARADU|nr:nuclear-pore anchor isoform X2 [Arachis duranensis]